MHGMYDISNGDFLYVLATFVVCPVEWVNAYEWRKLTSHEIRGLTNYYRRLGQLMGIKDIPETYEGFKQFYEDYETANFAFSPDALAVADSTLDLLGTFMPYKLLSRAVVRRMSFALMDDRLLNAFKYPKPTLVERILVRGGLKPAVSRSGCSSRRGPSRCSAVRRSRSAATPPTVIASRNSAPSGGPVAPSPPARRIPRRVPAQHSPRLPAARSRTT